MINVQKAWTALNEFQNAVNRIRDLSGLTQKADAVVAVLKDLKPGDLETLDKQRADLAARVSQLTAQSENLKKEVAGLQATLTAKQAEGTAKLEANAKARAAQLDAEHQKKINDMSAAFLKTKSNLQELEQRKADLTAEIAQLMDALDALKKNFANISASLR